MPSSHDPTKYHNVNAIIPLDLYEELRLHAFEWRVSMSEVVRRAVEAHLASYRAEEPHST